MAVGTDDRARALDLVPVSRETQACFETYIELLAKWQKVTNLVGPSELARIWTRHLADSAQLVDIVPEARTWVDLGSGAGFPGLVIAIRLKGVTGAAVDLVEGDKRKCAFLSAVVRATGAPARIHTGRIEDVLPSLELRPQAVTARALAPLPRLVELSRGMLENGAIGVFPKGRVAETELTDSGLTHRFRFELVPSRIDAESRIVLVRS